MKKELNFLFLGLFEIFTCHLGVCTVCKKKFHISIFEQTHKMVGVAQNGGQNSKLMFSQESVLALKHVVKTSFILFF